MKLIKLVIKRGFEKKTFEFTDGVNIIYSSKNSVGKTTLVRGLLYAQGFAIPSLRRLKFSRYEFELTIQKDDNSILNTYRHFKYIILKEGDKEQEISLPMESKNIIKKIFSIDNDSVLNNLLGTFYFDQDKGWTLLNRGTVIGDIHFNIEDFIRGLLGYSCDDLIVKYKKINDEIVKYNKMFEIAEYQKTLNRETGNLRNEIGIAEISRKIGILKFQRQPLENEVNRLRKVIRKNVRFIDYISDMKLRVRGTDNKEIKVNANTIIDFNENTTYLKTKEDMLLMNLSIINNQISKLEQELNASQVLFDTKTMIQKFDENISKMQLDQQAILGVLKQLDKESKKLSEKIRHITEVKGEQIISELHMTIRKYSKELGLDDNIVPDDRKYILTDNLTQFSGAIYHKLVFAFKLSYILAVEKYTGCCLPIILDSPSGRELDNANIDGMMKILMRDFSKHQIIIASIHKYHFENPNLITLKNQLLGF